MSLSRKAALKGGAELQRGTPLRRTTPLDRSPLGREGQASTEARRATPIEYARANGARSTFKRPRKRRATAPPVDPWATPGCWLAQFTDAPCDGRLVRCHLLPKRLMRQEYPEGALWLVGRCEAISRQVWRRDHLEAVTNIPVMRKVGIATLEFDERSWVWGCGGACGNTGHHGMLDTARTLRIPRASLPPGLEGFAAELGLTWWLEREYGAVSEPVREAVA